MACLEYILWYREFVYVAAAVSLVVIPGVIEPDEDPLGPFIVRGIGCIDLAVPVIRKAEGLELLAEPLNVLLGRDFGMRAGFNRILLGR